MAVWSSPSLPTTTHSLANRTALTCELPEASVDNLTSGVKRNTNQTQLNWLYKHSFIAEWMASTILGALETALLYVHMHGGPAQWLTF